MTDSIAAAATPPEVLNETIGRWLLTGELPDMLALPFDVRVDLARLVVGPRYFEPVWTAHAEALRAQAAAWNIKPRFRRRDGTPLFWAEHDLERSLAELRQSNKSLLDVKREHAVHEAGHATIAALLGIAVDAATIETNIVGVGGYVLHGRGAVHPDVDLDDLYHAGDPTARPTAEDMPAYLLFFLAGEAAQARLTGEPDDLNGGARDRAMAFEWLGELLELPDDDPIVRRAWQKVLRPLADALVEREWDRIERLAGALLLRGRVDRPELLEHLKS